MDTDGARSRGAAVPCGDCGALVTTPFFSCEENDPGSDQVLKVIVVFVGVPCCSATLERYMQSIEEIYRRDRRFEVLWDARRIGIPSRRVLQVQASFMQKLDPLTRRLVRCSAIVVSSKLAKNMLRVLFRMKPPACPLRIFEDLDMARAFLSTGTTA